MVARLRRQQQTHPNVRLEYSDALWRINLSDLQTFNPLDAWHPSIPGHDTLAKTAFNAIAPSLAFVGVNPKSRHSLPGQVAQVKAR